jgi:hypothetical protein
LEIFLTLLAQRMGMVKRGAEPDITRAAQYFVKWWREEGGLIAASSSLQTGASLTSAADQRRIQGWGFDFQWQLGSKDAPTGKADEIKMVQEKMEACIDEYLMNMDKEDADENNVSATQIKKKQVLEAKMKRKLKHSKR